MLIPNPPANPSHSHDSNEFSFDASTGIAVWGSFDASSRTAGADHKGKPAPMGAIVNQDFEDKLNEIADKIKSGNHKEVDLTLNFAKWPQANYVPFEQSLKNGLDNIEKYLMEKTGNNNLKVNKTYNITEAKGSDSVNTLEVKLK